MNTKMPPSCYATLVRTKIRTFCISIHSSLYRTPRTTVPDSISNPHFFLNPCFYFFVFAYCTLVLCSTFIKFRCYSITVFIPQLKIDVSKVRLYRVLQVNCGLPWVSLEVEPLMRRNLKYTWMFLFITIDHNPYFLNVKPTSIN